MAAIDAHARDAFWTGTIGVGAMSLSGVAVLLHACGALHLAASVIIAAPLTMVALIAAAARTNPATRALFLQRLGAGCFAGFIGVIAYDALRWLVLVSGLVPFNPFRAIEVFGLLIMRAEVDTWLTKTAGWLFHSWNGLAFASMYTLALGRGRLWWALVWALTLEAAMLSTYPSMFRIALDWPFVAVSVIGHIAYGLGFGLVARGAVKK